MKTIIKNAQLILPDSIEKGGLLIEDDRISEIYLGDVPDNKEAQVINAKGDYVSPGFIDTECFDPKGICNIMFSVNKISSPSAWHVHLHPSKPKKS